MSQQEFFPPSSESKGSRNTQPFQWSVESTRPRRPSSSANEDTPKSEHPSTFESEIPPYSYPAQDQPPFNQPYQESLPRRQQQQARGGASYQSPQSQQRQQHWEVPWWARPQPNAMQGIPGWVFVIGAILLLLPFIPAIFVLISILLTGLVVIALIPLIIIGALFFIGMVVFILFLAGTASRGWGGRWRW